MNGGWTIFVYLLGRSAEGILQSTIVKSIYLDGYRITNKSSKWYLPAPFLLLKQTRLATRNGTARKKKRKKEENKERYPANDSLSAVMKKLVTN